MLLKSLEVGAHIWHTWGEYRGMMMVQDVLNECPHICDVCDISEYGGNDQSSLRALWRDGIRDQSSGSITIVRLTGHEHDQSSGTGFSYGLDFDGDSVYVFDPHGPRASLSVYTDFDMFARFVGLMYKGGQEIILYSGLLIQKKKDEPSHAHECK